MWFRLWALGGSCIGLCSFLSLSRGKWERKALEPVKYELDSLYFR